MSKKNLTILSLALLALVSVAMPAGAVTYYWSSTSNSYQCFDTNRYSYWWPTFDGTTFSGTHPTVLTDLQNADQLVIPLDDRRVKLIAGTGTSFSFPQFTIGNKPSGTFDVAWLTLPEVNVQDGTANAVYNWSNLIIHRGIVRCYGTAKTWAGKLTLDGTVNLVPRGGPLTVSAEVDATGSDNIYVMPYLYNYSSTGQNTGSNAFAWQPSACWFYGTWIIRDRIQAKSSGAMGEADIQLHSILPTTSDGVTTYMTPTGYTVYTDCPGIIDVSVSDAISSNAGLNMTTAYYGTVATPIVSRVNTTVPVTVRWATMNGVDIPAGTYNSTNATVTIGTSTLSWVGGAGTVTVRETLGSPTLAKYNLTMACAEPNSKTYPLIGSTKAYAAGNVVKIKAVNDPRSSWAFDHWSSSTGSGIASTTSASTTVTIPTGSNITVTANYVLAAGTPSPAVGASAISNFTGLSWTPVSGASTQAVYFDTANPPTTIAPVATGGVSLSSLTNAQIGGPLADSTTYYWTVKTNGMNGAVWSFTTANATPNTPTPADGTTERPVDSTLSWMADSSATSYDVYISTSQALVSAGDASVKTTVTSASLPVTGLTRGMYYYWKVVAGYPGSITRVGPVWSFRVNTYKLNVKLDTVIPTYSLDGAADVNGYIDDANIAVFKFASFNLNNQWDIVVTGTSRKGVAIWSDADIAFGGLFDVSANMNSAYVTTAGAPRAGGYVGQPKSADTVAWADKAVSGPGRGTKKVSSWSGGGGAGYGGIGGDYGFKDTTGGWGGVTYGEQELYTLWGGSGGGGGIDNPAGSGGGIIEFYAKGNITISSSAALKSNGAAGGDPLATRCGPGGGSGGSVRLVATGNVSVAGTVTANGGAGSSATSQTTQGGGGGGGGRIAIYHGGSLAVTGTVTATGGVRGNIASTAATDGGAGTVFTAGNSATLMAAHNLYPANNATGVSVYDPNFNYIAFNPALGATESKLYFGISSGSMSLVATYADANGLRARRVYRPALAEATQYYWRVDTNGVTGATMTFRSAGREAHTPNPVNGATDVEVHNPRLSWQMYSTSGTKWEVYLGTSSTSLTLKKTITDPNALIMYYDAGELLASRTYYWRVDETSNQKWTGFVWSFTTRAATCPAASKPIADLSGDCKVTFLDIALLAGEWKVCNLTPSTDCQ
jgi:hypothetical protein